MLRPPAVRKGALVGVVAPASPVKAEFVERGVAELESLGFRVRLGPHLYERERYTAGSVDQRTSDLLEIWNDPDVEAVFAARGGYGSMELLSSLQPEWFRDRPRVFLGASDITAILSYLVSSVGLVCFHGPMVAQKIARGLYDASGLLRLIRESEPGGTLSAEETEMLHGGTGEGVLWGGCLSIVASLVGTPHSKAPTNGILFLEDTQVKPYQIDRMLTQLRLAGHLESVRGIVFGEMIECEQHKDQGYTIQEMLRDWTAHLRVPVLFGLPSGHTRTNALTLPLGVRVRLDRDGLTVLEGAVQ